MARDLYYWDANVFSGFLNEEPDKVADCETVLKEAQAGHILLVTSALTLAEVLFIKNGPKLDASQRDRIDRFFKADYITVRNVTRIIADLARDVFWSHNIKPKDCVHVSTAAFSKVPTIHTFDEYLLGKSGLTVNRHTLKIARPRVPHQMDMIDESGKES